MFSITATVSARLAFSLSPSKFLRDPIKFPSTRGHARRQLCATAAKKKVIFLGTPQVAANTLSKLTQASKSDLSNFQVTAVVSQPPAPTGRKRVLTKSPVHSVAEQLGIPVLTPRSAKDPQFLSKLEALEPDLCITAAYGNFLPSQFLSLPNYGTLNIHPSLLPKFRGAAPVPRALQAGVDKTGVSILFTVLKMDAGPIVAVTERKLDGSEQAPQLLEELFDTGTDTLLKVMPSVWNDSMDKVEQDEDQASHAPKLAKEEGKLTFTENAHFVHNKVRAFAGWPGTWADFLIGGVEVRLKIGKTVVLRGEGGMCFGIHHVSFSEDENCMVITCGDGSKIGLVQVQPPGKKGMDAKSFWNGLRGKEIERKRLPY